MEWNLENYGLGKPIIQCLGLRWVPAIFFRLWIEFA